MFLSAYGLSHLSVCSGHPELTQDHKLAEVGVKEKQQPTNTLEKCLVVFYFFNYLHIAQYIRPAEHIIPRHPEVNRGQP